MNDDDNNNDDDDDDDDISDSDDDDDYILMIRKDNEITYLNHTHIQMDILDKVVYQTNVQKYYD